MKTGAKLKMGANMIKQTVLVVLYNLNLCINQDGVYKYYEVIFVDLNHKAVSLGWTRQNIYIYYLEQKPLSQSHTCLLYLEEI